MTSFVPASAFLLASILAASAHAQVYRCGESSTYTDKPCHGAKRVDLRPNMMDAGPRVAPVDEPQPAIIMREITPPAAPAAAPPATSIWQQRDSRASDYQQRTGPFTGPSTR